MGECKRCGTCCRNGGPCLHSEDRHMIVDGILPSSGLVTYRQGEFAVNPVTGELIRLDREMIKIRGKNVLGECIYLDDKGKQCGIYDRRPLECRTLRCWNPRDIEELFLKDLLSRRDLIPAGSLLSKFIDKYERSFHARLIFELSSPKARAYVKNAVQLERMQHDDLKFRRDVCDMLDIDMNSCDFFFGRPVSMLADTFGAFFLAEPN